MSNVGRKLTWAAEDVRAIARRKILRQRLKLSRFLKGEAPSTEYDWGCDYPQRSGQITTTPCSLPLLSVHSAKLTNSFSVPSTRHISLPG